MTNTLKTLDDAELDAVQGGAASRHRDGIVAHRQGGHHSDEQKTIQGPEGNGLSSMQAGETCGV